MSERINATDFNELSKLINEFETLSCECKSTLFKSASTYCRFNSTCTHGGLDGLWGKLLCHALNCLCDRSPEIRRGAVEFMGDLSRAFKEEVYTRSKSHIFQQMRYLLENDKSSEDHANDETCNSSSDEHPSANAIKSVSVHKHLDSWICCIEEMVRGTGAEICREVDSELLVFVMSCLDCKDMYLEQDCLKLVYTLLHDCKLFLYLKHPLHASINTNNQKDAKNIKDIREVLALILLKGMFNPNPGVRYQSCKAIKEIFSSEKNLESADIELMDALLPAIWFNRYNKENVLQQLCQETWVEITEGNGKLLIERHFKTAMSYCLEKLDGKLSLDCTNSCHCLSEVVRKLDPQLVAPKVTEIYIHLKQVVNEDRMGWQTLDAACLLLGDMVSNYPMQMESYLDELIQIMSGKVRFHQSTNVMDSSALILGKLVKFYGKDRSNLELMLDRIEESFHNFISYSERSDIQSSTTSVLLNAITIERKEDTHEIRPLGRLESLQLPNQIYGHFCLLLHLLSVLPQEHPPKLSKLITEVWMVLKALDRLKLNDLAILILWRVEEFMDTLTKQKQKQQIDLFLETLVNMAKQSHHLQLHQTAMSLLEKLWKNFGKNIMKTKLTLLDQKFAADFADKHA